MVTKYQDLLKKLSYNLNIPEEEVTGIFEEYCKDLEDNIRNYTEPEFDYFRIGKLRPAIPKILNHMKGKFFDEKDRAPLERILNKIRTIYKHSKIKVRHPSFRFTEDGFKEPEEMAKQREDLILQYLKENGPSYPRTIAKETGQKETAYIMFELKKLLKEGKILRTGKNKGTKYLLNN